MSFQYRSILEVLKFTSPKDTLRTTPVSATWLKASDSFELWTEYFPFYTSISPPKLAYRKWLFARRNLVYVGGQKVKVYNCVQRKWTGESRLSREVEVSYCAGAVLLDCGEKVMLCGGGDVSIRPFQSLSVTYLVDLTGTVTTLHSLNVCRANHGIIEVNEAVYIFGGTQKMGLMSGNVSATERIISPFVGNSWEILPEMPNPDWGFNPCNHYEVIYLPGKEPSHLYIQTFDTRNFLYTRLNITISKVSSGQMTLCRYGEELVVLQTQRVTVVDVVREVIVMEKVLGGTFANGAMSPVVYAGKLWYVDYVSGRVFAFDLASHRLPTDHTQFHPNQPYS